MSYYRRPPISQPARKPSWRHQWPGRRHTPSPSTPAGLELQRLIRAANAGLARKAQELASDAEGSRNNTLFALGVGLGTYVFHGLLSFNALEMAASTACVANGLLHEDGRLAVLATLHNGIARAKDDLRHPHWKNGLGKRKSPRC